MKTIALILLFAISGSMTVLGQDAEQAIAVHALGGKKWNDKNGNKVPCFNYSRGNHQLRLEDVNVHKETKDGKIRYWGTFTITNRKRLTHDPHVFVDFEVTEGKVEHLKLRSDGGHNWYDALPNDWMSKGSKKILDVIYHLGHWW